MLIAFFEIRPGEKEFLQSALSTHKLLFFEQAASAENFPAEANAAEVISTHAQSKIDTDLITKTTKLKLVSTRTTGFDHIDLKTAEQKNIVVCNVPSYGEKTVAEFAFALILAISRKIPQAVDITKREQKFDFSTLQGFDLAGKTLGVVGTGKIGTHLIQIAKGFEMEIVAFDAFPNQTLAEKLGFKYLALDQLLESADLISFHVPSLPSTHHLLNKDNISKIKKGAVVINTARGEVIETEALVKALNDGIISAAGLDVLECEDELKKDWQMCTVKEALLNMELIKMPNVFVTPHTAFNTKEAEQRILQTTVENINGFVVNNPKNLVKAQI